MPWVKDCPRCLIGTVYEDSPTGEEVCRECAIERAKARWDRDHEQVLIIEGGGW